MNDWRVFWYGDLQEEGREIVWNRDFVWGGRRWRLPSLYLFEQGVVLDFLMEAEAEELSAFIEKWDLLHEEERDYTEIQREQIEQEHPLNVRFTAELTLDSIPLQYKGCTSTLWIPTACVGEQQRTDRKMAAAMEHYGLDAEKGWSFCRCRFRFTEGTQSDFQSMELKLQRDEITLFGPSLSAPKAGDRLSFRDPINGQQHMLTVQSICSESLEQGNGALAYYQLLTYCVEPQLPVNLRDVGPSECGSVPILAAKAQENTKLALSSIKREPVTSTDWQLCFPMKGTEDLSLSWTKNERGIADETV